MDQSTVTQQPAQAMKPRGKMPRVAFIQAGWHRHIVSQAHSAFVEECGVAGLSPDAIDLFDVPGSLEIPLQAKLLAKGGNYAVIVAAGLIVDGGIYRHDFVAATVLDAMMQVQLEVERPILSIVLTPHQFQESEAHQAFFRDHFKVKGREAAQACLQTLANLDRLASVA
jgi:6,7-dimethyl-8-ribityllumazine synthase